jgi:hypothetical protein
VWLHLQLHFLRGEAGTEHSDAWEGYALNIEERKFNENLILMIH